MTVKLSSARPGGARHDLGFGDVARISELQGQPRKPGVRETAESDALQRDHHGKAISASFRGTARATGDCAWQQFMETGQSMSRQPCDGEQIQCETIEVISSRRRRRPVGQHLVGRSNSARGGVDGRLPRAGRTVISIKVLVGRSKSEWQVRTLRDGRDHDASRTRVTGRTTGAVTT